MASPPETPPAAETNRWCRELDIPRPRLELVAKHPEANTFSLLVVALLERGEPMTLDQVAARFDEAGVAPHPAALGSLKRCRPGRPPVIREGDHYRLDPDELADESLEHFVRALDLRVPELAAMRRAPADLPPLPGPEEPLTESELDEAWMGASLFRWPVHRLVLAALDAHGGPLDPREVVDALSARTVSHPLDVDPAKFKRPRSPVRVLSDGRWAMAENAAPKLIEARRAVRRSVLNTRQHGRADLVTARVEASLRRKAILGSRFAKLPRALVFAYLPHKPRLAALVDVGKREITTFIADEIADLPARLEAYSIIAALDVRALLRTLGFSPGRRRLEDLHLLVDERRWRKLGLTPPIDLAQLVQSSCRIAQPFTEPARMIDALQSGQLSLVRRQLERDARSLCALYEYGRLHGGVRIRTRGIDEMLPVDWSHFSEPTLYDLRRASASADGALEVVTDPPEWDDPWRGARRVTLHFNEATDDLYFVDEAGNELDDWDFQRARLAVPIH